MTEPMAVMIMILFMEMVVQTVFTVKRAMIFSMADVVQTSSMAVMVMIR